MLTNEVDQTNFQVRYKRGEKEKIKETRVYGILTNKQVGHIPSIDIYFSEEQNYFIKDTYIFKSLPKSTNGQLKIDLDKEMKNAIERTDFSR